MIVCFGYSEVSLVGRRENHSKSTRARYMVQQLGHVLLLQKTWVNLLFFTMLSDSQQYVTLGKGQSNASSFC